MELPRGTFRRLKQVLVAGPGNHAQTDGDRFGFFLVEGDWREVIPLTNDVANARFLMDWRPHRLQGGDVTVDRTLGHFEFSSKNLRHNRCIGCPKDLNDLDEPVGFALCASENTISIKDC